jgi:hypothetical protein
MVRATDGVGNTVATPLTAVVDQEGPTVNIASPVDGTDLQGTTVILGTVTDDHLESYQIDYMRGTTGEWQVVQPSQRTSGVSGTLATWITSGLSDDTYTLRITATDALGNTGMAAVTVNLMGAYLSLSPSDITFSDSHPLPGDSVKVMVTVRNSGDSPAEDVTVVLYSDGKMVEEQAGITIPPRGTYVAIFPVKAKEGSSVYTARASSDLYDTGQMTSGNPLNTIEEEGVLENVSGVLGLIALVLAVMLLAIFLVARLSKGKVEELVESEPEDIIVDPLEGIEEGREPLI